MKKIAIVGSGISGLTVAYCLSTSRNSELDPVKSREPVDLTLYEADDRIGGHTATVDVQVNGNNYAVDTGFIVYNDWTYPNFIKLLQQLEVGSRDTRMSFSVSCEDTGLEYAGSNFNTLFAQRSNILKPVYWQMLGDIVRFNKEAVVDLEKGVLDEGISLGDYLARNRYGNMFREKYLIPMAAAIWSSGTPDIPNFPALFFVRFFKNHGLLSIKKRPQWRTITGGSRSYLQPLSEHFQSSIRLGANIESVRRERGQVLVRERNGKVEQYDAIVFATHSDQALSLLEEASALEREIVGAIPYQDNDVVLHTDTKLLPKRPLAWSCWNYRIANGSHNEPLAKLTYNMNLLQGLDCEKTFCVSLNQTNDIQQEKVLGSYSYSHPVFNLTGIAAQARWEELAGHQNTWFCGAYWRNGFHEDGVVSALNVVDDMDANFLIGEEIKSHVA